MNIQHLRYFEVIAYYENISKAAQQLMISQPALSNVLQQLESELETPLFDRQGKKITLNKAGQAFLYTAKSVLRMLDSNVQYLKETSWLSGALQICVTASCNEIFQILSDYGERYPTVQFKVMSADKLQGDPALSPFDLLVTSNRGCAAGDQWVRIAQREGMYAVFRADHPLADRTSVRLDELAEEQFCFVSRNGDKLGHVYTQCMEAGMIPKVRYITDSTGFAASLLQEGCCVALTYNTKLRQFSAENLRTVPIEDAYIGHSDIYLCLLHREQPPLAKHFFRFVCDRLRITGEAESLSNPG